MSTKMLQLGQKWPDGYADNVYWIGADPNHARIQHGDGLVILGRECRSLAELEAVAAQIRHELDKVLEGARTKLLHAR